MFGWQTQTFCYISEKSVVPNSSQTDYSLSDSSLAIAFTISLTQNVRVFHPNLANIIGAPLRVCTNIRLSQLRKMLILFIANNTISRVCIVRNRQTREIVLSAMCNFYNRN